MNILVTGTSGFIGGACARALISSHHTVWGWSRNYNAECGIEKARYIEQDLFADVALKHVPDNLDCIVHCAGIAGPAVALQNPTEAFRVNILGTERIFSLARGKKTPIVFASSVYIYDGCTEFPWHEEMEVRPRSPLGASKLGAEAIARVYTECFNVSSVALRIFTVYGPGSSEAQFIPSAFKKISMAKDSVEFGSPQSTRDFIFIDDVVRGVIASIDFLGKNPGFHIFNIGSGIEVSIEKCVGIMVKMFGKPGLKVEFGKMVKRADEAGGYSRHLSSMEKVRRLLGWQSTVSFEEGLKKTYDALRSTSL